MSRCILHGYNGYGTCPKCEQNRTISDVIMNQQAEIERLRRVEQQHERLKKAARDFVDGPSYTTWDDNELVRVRSNFAKLKAALRAYDNT